MFSLPIETFRNVIPIGIITCWTKIRCKKPSLYFKYFWDSILQIEKMWITALRFGIELKQHCQVGSWKTKCEYQSEQQPSVAECMEIRSSIDKGISIKKRRFTWKLAPRKGERQWTDINCEMGHVIAGCVGLYLCQYLSHKNDTPLFGIASPKPLQSTLCRHRSSTLCPVENVRP